VFRVTPSRDSEILRAMLNETLGGVIGCDCFSAYYKCTADNRATVPF